MLARRIVFRITSLIRSSGSPPASNLTRCSGLPRLRRTRWRTSGLAGLLLMGGSLLWGPSPARAATFYLGPDGSDAASGSFDAPWRSLSYASSHLSPGDTLTLL